MKFGQGLGGDERGFSPTALDTLPGMKTEPPALLFGPYHAPSLSVGERVSCLYRDCDVVVTDWSDAPIPWPLCRRLGRYCGAASLLVDDELARAIRHESAVALGYWWGVQSDSGAGARAWASPAWTARAVAASAAARPSLCASG